MASPSSFPDVIEWDEAMLQCGEDEEFLRELLGDLRQESHNQVSVIESIIQVGILWLLNCVGEEIIVD
jgi:hypothetical protein